MASGSSRSDLPVKLDTKTGTVSCSVAGKRHRLRRPLFGEYRQLRELFYEMNDEIAESGEEYRAADDELKDAIAEATTSGSLPRQAMRAAMQVGQVVQDVQEAGSHDRGVLGAKHMEFVGWLSEISGADLEELLAAAADAGDDLPPEDRATVAALRKRKRHAMRALTARQEESRARFVKAGFEMLSDQPLTTDDEDPLAGFEPWMIGADFSNALIQHWQAVPLDPGSQATE